MKVEKVKNTSKNSAMRHRLCQGHTKAMNNYYIKTGFFLDWFNKKTSKNGGNLHLDGISEDELRSLLHLSPDVNLDTDIFYLPDASVPLLADRIKSVRQIPVDPIHISYEIRKYYMKTAFFLDWFNKKTSRHGGNMRLDGISEDELRILLHLATDVDIHKDVFFLPDESVPLLAERLKSIGQIPVDPIHISYEIREAQDVEANIPPKVIAMHI